MRLAVLIAGSLVLTAAMVAAEEPIDLPVRSYDAPEAAATERADAACAGAEALSPDDIEKLRAEADAALRRAEARVEGAKLEAIVATHRVTASAIRAAAAAGEREYLDLSVETMLAGIESSERKLAEMGGAEAVEALVARLRAPDAGPEEMAEAEAMIARLDEALPGARGSLTRVYRSQYGDAGAIDEQIGAELNLEGLLLAAPLETANAELDRESLRASVAALTADFVARIGARRYASRLRACLDRLPEADPASDVAECRRHEGPVRAEFFADVLIHAPLMECDSSPCFDGQNKVHPARIYANGCIYACLTNWGDRGAIRDLELYGLVDAAGQVDARLLFPHTGTECRGQEQLRPRLWEAKTGSDLEFLVTGTLVLPEAGGTVTEGSGRVAVPPAMPAAWAEKLGGASGSWQVVPTPDWAQ